MAIILHARPATSSPCFSAFASFSNWARPSNGRRAHTESPCFSAAWASALVSNGLHPGVKRFALTEIGYVGRILLYKNPFDGTGFNIQICCLILAPVRIIDVLKKSSWLTPAGLFRGCNLPDPQTYRPDRGGKVFPPAGPILHLDLHLVRSLLLGPARRRRRAGRNRGHRRQRIHREQPHDGRYRVSSRHLAGLWHPSRRVRPDRLPTPKRVQSIDRQPFQQHAIQAVPGIPLHRILGHLHPMHLPYRRDGRRVEEPHHAERSRIHRAGQRVSTLEQGAWWEWQWLISSIACVSSPSSASPPSTRDPASPRCKCATRIPRTGKWPCRSWKPTPLP